MKRLFFLTFCLIVATGQAQVKIGADVSSIHEGSILELESDSRALVLTRVTQQQMDAIFPLNGALVYNTDVNCVFYYDSFEWVNLCADPGSTGSGASLEDNSDGTFTFTDGSGNQITFYGVAETVTTLSDNGDGTISYTNETGQTVTISTGGATNFADLTGLPAGLTDGDDDTTYSAGTGLTLTGTTFAVNTSELSFDFADLTGLPANLDTDSTDDFSGAFADLTGVPADLTDGDDDTTYSAGTGLTLTGTTFAVNNNELSFDFSDLTGLPANLDTDSTDDFSGAFTDLTGVPAGLTDGDDDTTYSAGTGLTLTGTIFAVNNNELSFDFSDLTGVPANLDTDSTDDFSGAFADLTGIPANLDTDSTDDFSGAFADLTGVPANLDTDSTDDFSGDFTDLTNIPVGLSDGDDDTQLSEAEVDAYVSNNNFLTSTSAISTPILTTTGNITLNASHHTVILGGSHTITLPVAATSTGRIYIIKNASLLGRSVSSYVNFQGISTTVIPPQTTIGVQSDGSNWQQIQ